MLTAVTNASVTHGRCVECLTPCWCACVRGWLAGYTAYSRVWRGCSWVGVLPAATVLPRCGFIFSLLLLPLPLYIVQVYRVCASVWVLICFHSVFWWCSGIGGGAFECISSVFWWLRRRRRELRMFRAALTRRRVRFQFRFMYPLDTYVEWGQCCVLINKIQNVKKKDEKRNREYSLHTDDGRGRKIIRIEKPKIDQHLTQKWKTCRIQIIFQKMPKD